MSVNQIITGKVLISDQHNSFPDPDKEEELFDESCETIENILEKHMEAARTEILQHFPKLDIGIRV